MIKQNLLPLFLIALFVVGCSSKSANSEESKSVIENEVSNDDSKEKKSKKEKPFKVKEDGLYAQIETAKGVITIKLEFEKAPLTVMNFMGLIEGTKPNDVKGAGEPYYDGLKFHRVVPNFVIQGGDPTGTGSGGPGYRFPDEFHRDLLHTIEGTLSMANSGPATNGSQFFITHTATPHLDFRHSVFGYVIDGMDVVNAIREGDVMDKVTIIRKGKAADAFVYSDAKWAEYTANAPVQNKEQMELLRKEKEAKDLKKVEGIKAAKAGKTEYKSFLKGLATELCEDGQVMEAGDGLFFCVTEFGDGAKPKAGQKVKAKYKGSFPGGAKFDEGVYEFELVTGSVIEGWHVGFAELNKGAKATLVIPYWLGYGDRPQFGGQMPAYSTLIFEVELLDIN